MSVPDDEADRLAGIAAQLVARIRDDDPRANAAWLCAVSKGPVDWLRLCFVLAAAVPTDRSWRQLTAWTRASEERPGGPDTPDNIERRRDILEAALWPRHRRLRREAA